MKILICGQLSYGIYIEDVYLILDSKPPDRRTISAVVDTIFRSSDNPKQQVTRGDSDNIEYVSIVSMNRTYKLGIVMSMLPPR